MTRATLTILALLLGLLICLHGSPVRAEPQGCASADAECWRAVAESAQKSAASLKTLLKKSQLEMRYLRARAAYCEHYMDEIGAALTEKKDGHK